MVEEKFISQGCEFTGIRKFKGKLSGKKAIICCSGTSLKTYVDHAHPEEWVRIAVNEGIRKISDTADFWVLSDKAIVDEYGDICEPHTTILAMHQSSKYTHKFKVPDIYTTNSMPLPAKKHDNGYEFFSRGTVMIGAVEMARYMGINEFYVFGLDCYRTETDYYYDGRTPEHTTERNPTGARKGWGYKEGVLVSDRLQRMIHVLDAVKSSGLWDDIKIYCVNSPMSQQTAVPHMTLEELSEIEKAPKKFPSLVERGLEDYNKSLSKEPMELKESEESDNVETTH